MPKSKWFRFGTRWRLMLASSAALLTGLLLPHWMRLWTRTLCAWDVGMLSFLGMIWFVMLRATPNSMRRQAQREDIGRLVILGLITAAACFSVLAIGFILHDNKNISANLLALHVALAGTTILGSWLLVHTIFALHYAHGYYHNSQVEGDRPDAEPLDFPDDVEPDYWDFLYFSFVIGMTSQVSDVEIRSRAMRRLALLHGVISFFFNTAILAMSINIIAGLI